MPLPQEPRSWETKDVQIDPLISPKPTNAQLARQGNQLHECVESLRDETQKELKGVKREIKGLSQEVAEIREHLLPKGKKVAGLSTDGQAFRRTVWAVATGGGALVFFYKVAIAIWPGVVAIALDLDHAIRSGGL